MNDGPGKYWLGVRQLPNEIKVKSYRISIDIEETKEVRLELMGERKVFVN